MAGKRKSPSLGVPPPSRPPPPRRRERVPAKYSRFDAKFVDELERAARTERDRFYGEMAAAERAVDVRYAQPRWEDDALRLRTQRALERELERERLERDAQRLRGLEVWVPPEPPSSNMFNFPGPPEPPRRAKVAPDGAAMLRGLLELPARSARVVGS